MELWDLYTEDRVLTGKSHVRGEEIPENLFHLVVHVWIKNSKGQYLISQRAADRPTCPLMWETVGGSVLKGENSLQGALREVKEEVGIDLSSDKGKLIFSKVRKAMGRRKFNDILDVWCFEYDGEAHLDKAETKEVEQSKWLSKEEIRKLYDEKLLVDTLSYFFENSDI